MNKANHINFLDSYGNYNKIKDAVYSTKGEYLTYNGEYIEAMYHSTSNGKTESSLEYHEYVSELLVSESVSCKQMLDCTSVPM